MELILKARNAEGYREEVDSVACPSQPSKRKVRLMDMQLRALVEVRYDAPTEELSPLEPSHAGHDGEQRL